MNGLDVWLYGTRVARLTEPSTYRYQLVYTDEAFDRWGEGARVLSLNLPVTRKAIRDSRDTADLRVSAFLEGLLPEGNLRRHVATQLKVPTVDKMSLLTQVGKECAGAVQFLPPDYEPVTAQVRRLTDEEVVRLVADLPTYHLPAGAQPQASLAGVQDKVLLTRLPAGGWGWPEGGAASTHIIKPEPAAGAVLDHLVQTEDWSLRVARRAGLMAAGSEIATFGGRQAIVVERYDRNGDGLRIHQEDFAQALGLDPEAKYESTADYEANGSRLKRLCDVAAVRAEDPTLFRETLLEAVTFNVISGNGDAHSKNYSVLIGPRGEVTMAPLYDTAPVFYLSARFSGTGHVIGGRTNLDWVSSTDLVNEATSWGLGARRSAAVVQETMERTYEAAHAEDLPDEVAGLVLGRLDRAWEARSWSIAAGPTQLGVEPEPTGKAGSGTVHVEAHTRADGTFVPAHSRRAPKPRGR